MNGSDNDEILRTLVVAFYVILIAAMILLLRLQFAFLSFESEAELRPVSATSHHLSR